MIIFRSIQSLPSDKRTPLKTTKRSLPYYEIKLKQFLMTHNNNRIVIAVTEATGYNIYVCTYVIRTVNCLLCTLFMANKFDLI